MHVCRLNVVLVLKKKRFPCLNISLRAKLQNSIAIIVTCFVLHKIALPQNDHWKYNEIQNGNQEDDAEAQEIFFEKQREIKL